ncbi:MAG: SDR family oxidoreductase [Alcanivoracaceae bacterium]
MTTQRVLITGGASGLGRALAEAWLARGARVLITDINDERGAETVFALKGRGEIHYQRANTCVAEDWVRLLEWVEENFNGLDVLVNNAGVAAAGRIDRVSMDDWDWIIDINLKGVVQGCRTFTPLFKKQGDGQIINIASLAAVACAPAMSSYNVTKAGVVALSETLRHELAPYGIRVSVVCPSFFQTNLADTMRTPEEGMDSTVRKLLAGGKIDADEVARRILKGAGKNRLMILPHSEGKMLWWMKRYLPPVFNYALGDAGRKLKRKLERTS